MKPTKSMKLDKEEIITLITENIDTSIFKGTEYLEYGDIILNHWDYTDNGLEFTWLLDSLEQLSIEQLAFCYQSWKFCQDRKKEKNGEYF